MGVCDLGRVMQWHLYSPFPHQIMFILKAYNSTCLNIMYSGIARGGAQGAGAPPSDLDMRLMLIYNYWPILTYFGKDIVCTLACKQKLRFKVLTLGVWSRYGAYANKTTCVKAAQESELSCEPCFLPSSWNCKLQDDQRPSNEGYFYMNAAFINQRKYELNISMA